MRTHLQILEEAGGYRAAAESLGLPADRVRFWQMRKRIPPTEWARVSEAGLAGLDELAAGAATKCAVQL